MTTILDELDRMIERLSFAAWVMKNQAEDTYWSESDPGWDLRLKAAAHYPSAAAAKEGDPDDPWPPSAEPVAVRKRIRRSELLGLLQKLRSGSASFGPELVSCPIPESSDVDEMCEGCDLLLSKPHSWEACTRGLKLANTRALDAMVSMEAKNVEVMALLRDQNERLVEAIDAFVKSIGGTSETMRPEDRLRGLTDVGAKLWWETKNAKEALAELQDKYDRLQRAYDHVPVAARSRAAYATSGVCVGRSDETNREVAAELHVFGAMVEQANPSRTGPMIVRVGIEDVAIVQSPYVDRPDCDVLCLDLEGFTSAEEAAGWLRSHPAPNDRLPSLVLAAVGPRGEDLSTFASMVGGITQRPVPGQTWAECLQTLLIAIRQPDFEDKPSHEDDEGGAVSREGFEETLAQSALASDDPRKRD